MQITKKNTKKTIRRILKNIWLIQNNIVYLHSNYGYLMTDQEIIEGLIARDQRITTDFFFVKCRPLFYTVMKYVFDGNVEYDEMVNELYLFLMKDDAAILRRFEYRSSVYQWLKVIAIRFFMKKSAQMIDGNSPKTPYDEQAQVVPESDASAEYDLERLFEAMPTKRYVYVIRRLILEDWEPEKLAQEMNITTANLYNIKRRSIAQMSRVALNDIKEYGK